MSYLIFPNQLFELKYFTIKPNEVYILEEPVFFGFRQEKMNFNKLKLVLHRASMKYYQSYLELHDIKVHYIEYNSLKTNYNILKSLNNDHESLYTFDLTDHYLEKKIIKYFKTIKFLDNPNFLVTEKQLNEYYMMNKQKKTIVHGHFYNWVKDQINILTNIKSYDSENRNPLHDNIMIPVLGTPSSKDKLYYEEAIEYVNKYFPDNIGPSNLELKDCWFAITHTESKKWLMKFIKERLDNFGTYQDAIRKDEGDGFENRSLFHSLIAPMLNIGLLSSKQIIDEVMKVKGKYSMNNIEGFLRQIIGWREYQRYCYLHYYDIMTKSNVFNNTHKLSNAWYNGTTGMPPVDDAIKDAFKYGYLHHIQRLMVMSNIFNLSDINPNEAYKWFMEFSVDSYDWLMTQNVYSMGMWADGGLTMRKPYISTATYVIGMSNYKKPSKKEIEVNGVDWTETWRALFYHKITSNREIFKKTPYIFQLKAWDKMDKKLKDQLMTISNDFITKMTT
jgi:deoxyribodipyrimidine photolyase-related protein